MIPETKTASQEFRLARQQSKIKKERRKKLVTKVLSDFANNTGLQGLRYIAEDGVSIVEKIFWVLVVILSVGMCAILINNVWIKWNTSPVIVSFNERVIHVGKVPFPSITICPQIKSKLSEFNFTRHVEKTQTNTSHEGSILDDLVEENDPSKGDDIALVCVSDTSDYDPVLKRKRANSSLVQHLVEVAPTVEDTFLSCEWKNKQERCEDVFKRVLTSEGVCYNFNALAAEEIFNKNNIQKDYNYLETTNRSKNWNLLNGYAKYDPNSYPRRASENGATPDLVVILTELNDDKDEICNSLNSGYKIYVQHPADVPQSSLYYYAALPNQVSSLALKFTMITTSESLVNYHPDVRQCYFPMDRPLRYFNTYTASNCLLECRSNYTFQKCGCVAFHMPHNDSRNICAFQSGDCIVKAQNELSINDEETGTGACKCYPDCHSIIYDAEILKTNFNLHNYLQGYMKVHNASIDFEGFMTFSKVEFYFKQPRFLSMQRSELFGATDFFANIGGLLGLFLGFSFVSLVEIFYFMSLRFFCEVKRDSKKEEVKEEEEERLNSYEKVKLNEVY